MLDGSKYAMWKLILSSIELATKILASKNAADFSQNKCSHLQPDANLLTFLYTNFSVIFNFPMYTVHNLTGSKAQFLA